MNRVMLLIGAAIVAIGAGVMAQVKPQMPADVGPGRVAWFDISTTDLARAKEFYGKMFDWTFTAVTGTDQAAEINSRGTAIGTIRGAEGAISGFNGVVYIQVDDVRRASEKAKSLGGTVVKGFPFNLPNGTGAISLILDPSGHPLGLYSRALMPTKTP
jgi:predicted enzyme related to lactoylglutathione lyase